RIRDAVPADCAPLSALAFASKAHWGYDDASMDACRDELTVRPDELARITVRIAVDGDDIVGFHGVDDHEVVWLFVRPDAMHRGIGARLFTDACDVARARGIADLRIEADPNAAGFYEHMGARFVGDVPSASIPGRALPLYSIDVSSKP